MSQNYKNTSGKSHTADMQQEKDQRNGRIIGIVAAVLLVIAILVGLLNCCDAAPTTDPQSGTTTAGIVYDDNSVVGGWNEADTNKIIENLNAKVEEGMINISMNTSPSFADGTAAGNLMIVNEGANRYPQVVELTRNDTQELIYKSGAIPVGSKIESAALDVDLDKGTYECTAMFYSVDPETGANLGCAGAIINITVLA